MANFPVNARGEPLDDRVRVVLAGNDVRIFEQYEVKQSFFTSPAAFACRIGSGETANELTKRFPPGTPYELRVGPVVQHTGRLDGYGPEDSSGATEVSLRGRDSLAPLHDAYVMADRSFANATFVQLTEQCLLAAGLTDFTIFPSNAANRLAISGASPFAVAVRQGAGFDASPFEVKDVVDEKLRKGREEANAIAAVAAAQLRANAPTAKPLQAKTGERLFEFLNKELKRAGLFLFAAGAWNTFILAQPRTNQDPLYELIRQRGARANTVNVLRARHHNDTTRRFARYVVRGRAGGSTKKAGRPQFGSEVVDEEMVALGFTKGWSKVDQDAKNERRALFLARRQMAEDRRQGWALSYTVKGHTLPLLGGGDRAVLAIDTMIRVRDDELGIYDDLWIESVTPRGSMSGTTTDLVLHRPEDLVLGDPDYA